MTRDEVVTLMKSSKGVSEWNDNCDAVKAAFGGYPDFWFEAIIQSGLMNNTLGPGSDEIKVVPLNLDNWPKL